MKRPNYSRKVKRETGLLYYVSGIMGVALSMARSLLAFVRERGDGDIALLPGESQIHYHLNNENRYRDK